MKILETSDTGFIDDLASLVKDMLSLAEHMDREMGMDDYRRNGARYNPDKYYGRRTSASDMQDATAYAFHGYQQEYQGSPVGRYHQYICEFQYRADHALREYKDKLG